MPDDWTLDRFLTFALGLSTLESLGPATIQELGEGLAWMIQEQAALKTRYQDIIASQTATIEKQAVTIAMQAAAIERWQHAMECVRPGIVLLGEDGAP
jgi:hypothetical protein